MRNKLKFTNGSELEPGVMFCIGSNYARHAKEMGGTVPPEPVIFLKPPQSLVNNNGVIILPHFSSMVHHEVELVIVIGKDCYNIQRNDAHKYIAGYGVGIDVTLRDIQNEAKKEGKPWAVSKGFYSSAPVSDIIPAYDFKDTIPNFDLSLKVNGTVRQKCNTSEMERTVPMLIEYISKVFSLREGDIIFTGTPEGVGKISSGDVLEAKLDELAILNVKAD